MQLTPLQTKIIKLVQTIPAGKVVSYGQVATALGMPRAARLVGQAMSKMEDTPDFPWWRVLNNKGYISIRGNEFATKRLQKELLEAEGIEVDSDFTLEIDKYRFYL
jgi:methylated-DNA-protein-cysteine methyltransferase related protein